MSKKLMQPIGQSKSFHALMDRVSNTAALDKPVLIVGERGTGKEMIASRLHFLSPRWEAQYVKVNCAAFSDERLDQELFGMDSRDDTNGRFFEANGGTMFLDNIETLSPRLQEKLMRAVEYGEYETSGEAETQHVDVHLITATRINLPVAAARGEFRLDLIDRLAFNVITLPPLRARREDIAPLAEHFGRKVSRDLGVRTFPGFTPEIMEILECRNWPGNIRELKTVIERNTAHAFLDDESLTHPISYLNFDPFESPYRLEGDIPEHPQLIETKNTTAPTNTEHIQQSQSMTGFNERVFIFERRLIDEALSQNDGHQGKAADYLALTYHSFRGLLRKHGLKK